MSLQKSQTKEEPESKAVLDPHDEIFEPHEEVSDESEMTGRASPFVYMLVICVCIGGFLFGYDTGGECYYTNNNNYFVFDDINLPCQSSRELLVYYTMNFT